jgi:hypothetical protein
MNGTNDSENNNKNDTNCGEYSVDRGNRSEEGEINADPNSDDDQANIIFVSNKMLSINFTFEIISKVRKLVLNFKNSPV